MYRPFIRFFTKSGSIATKAKLRDAESLDDAWAWIVATMPRVAADFRIHEVGIYVRTS